MATENQISAKLVRAIRNQKHLVLKTHGHAMQDPGWPDLYIVCEDISFWVETKGAATELTLKQKYIIRELKKRGQNVFVLRFVSEQLFIVEDENGELLRAFGFGSWKEAAEETIRSLCATVNG